MDLSGADREPGIEPRGGGQVPFSELRPDPIHARELGTFLRWLTLAAMVFGTAELVAGLWFADVPLLTAAAATGGYGLWLLIVAQPLLERGRIARAVIAVTGGLLAVVAIVELAIPSAAAVLAVTAVLAAVICLPYLDQRVLRPVMVAAWVAVVIVALVSEVMPSTSRAPGALLALLRTGGLSVGAALVMIGLWQFSSRLRSVIFQVTAARAQLSEMNVELRNRVAELETRDRETTLLAHIDELLEACETREEAAAVIQHDVAKLFPADSGVFYEPEPGTAQLLPRASWGDLTLGFRIEGARGCWGLRRGRSHLVLSPADGLLCDHADASLDAGSICVPLTAQGRVLGLLHLRCPGLPAGGKGLTELEERQRLAITVAQHVLIRLANLELRANLREQSIRDPLTGLYNRRYMEESLGRELLRAAREEATLGVMILDLDHFKRLNDRHGHVVGDLVLRRLAHLLISKIRGEDICCRFGGEEFVVILPKASLEDTRRRAESLRTATRSLRIETENELLAVTISIGVAAYPAHGDDSEALLRAADAALYQAKEEGRDRVVTAPRAAAAASEPLDPSADAA